jgi:hypothetical protein
MEYLLYMALPLVVGFLGGFVFRVIMKKIATPKMLVAGKKRNIGVSDRILRAFLGVVLVVLGLQLEGRHVVLFFAAGFCFFEAIFSWCAFYAAVGKNTCPVE